MIKKNINPKAFFKSYNSVNTFNFLILPSWYYKKSILSLFPIMSYKILIKHNLKWFIFIFIEDTRDKRVIILFHFFYDIWRFSYQINNISINICFIIIIQHWLYNSCFNFFLCSVGMKLSISSSSSFSSELCNELSISLFSVKILLLN